MTYLGRGARTGRWMLGFVVLGSLSGCPSKPRRLVETDAGDASAPRDSGTDSATDGGVDSGPVDASGAVVCTAGSAMELFRTAYLVGSQVPYGAVANVNGLLVGATVITEANYPFYDRVGGYMSQTGAVTAPSPISSSAMVMSSSISLVAQQNGFLVLFDETPLLGMPTDLWTRSADLTGVFAGAGPTALTNTMSSGESNGRLVRTSSGYLASWADSVGGPTTANLDANGALVGSSHVATASVGMGTTLEPLVIGTAKFAGYFGSDQFIHTIAIAADGSVTGSPVAISGVASTGNFGMTGGTSAGALVYEIPVSGGKTALQFRTINATGAATLAERTLTAVGDQGQRPSVAELAGGFLVLFRYVPASGSAKLRLMFVAGTGDPLSSVDLVDSFPATPRFSLHVSPDNEVYVVYHEAVTLTVGGSVSVNGASVKAMRVLCE